MSQPAGNDLMRATSISAWSAAEFGFARWEDLMPYGVGVFFLFGLGSLPAGWATCGAGGR